MSTPLKTTLFGCFLASLLSLGSGCVTTYENANRREAYEREDREILNEKLRRTDGDLEAFSAQLDDLRDDISRVQANAATTTQSQVAALQTSLQVLQQRMNDLEAQRISDREEIINKLTGKIAGMVNQAAPPPAAASSARTGTVSEYGYEHVVATGENLSKIAAAYGVGMQAIIQANSLSNPNSLRIGQKLFIPE